MILDKDTACSRIEIRSPRWKQRVIGVASYRVKEHNAIDIIAMAKDGRRYYPDTLYATGEFIRSCPTQSVSGGVLLYLVPIRSLEVLERGEKPVAKPEPEPEPDKQIRMFDVPVKRKKNKKNEYFN